MSESREQKVARLSWLTKEPKRLPMQRGNPMPTYEAGVIDLKQEITRLRAALREALVLAQTPGEGLTPLEWDHLQSVLVWAELKTRLDGNYTRSNEDVFDTLERVFRYRDPVE